MNIGAAQKRMQHGALDLQVCHIKITVFLTSTTFSLAIPQFCYMYNCLELWVGLMTSWRGQAHPTEVHKWCWLYTSMFLTF